MIETNRRSIEDATGLRVQHSPVCCVPVSGAERNLPDRSLSLLSSWHYRGQPTTNRQSPDGPGGLIVLVSGAIIPPLRPKKFFPRPDSVSLKKLSLTPIDLSSHPAPISPAFCFLIVASGYYVQSIDRSRRPWSMES